MSMEGEDIELLRDYVANKSEPALRFLERPFRLHGDSLQG